MEGEVLGGVEAEEADQGNGRWCGKPTHNRQRWTTKAILGLEGGSGSDIKGGKV